jgi:hypothetical protein
MPRLRKELGHNQCDKLHIICSQCEHMKLIQFICSLFNDAISSSEYVASNARMIYENWI